MISRRGLVGGLIAAPAIVAAGSLMPIRGVSLYDVMTPRRGDLFTIDMITREAVQMFKNSNAFIQSIDEKYDEAFGQTGWKVGSKLRIRMPEDYRYTAHYIDSKYVEHYEPLQLSAPLPVVAAAGVAVAVMTKNPVVSRRFWAR